MDEKENLKDFEIKLIQASFLIGKFQIGLTTEALYCDICTNSEFLQDSLNRVAFKNKNQLLSLCTKCQHRFHPFFKKHSGG